MESALVVIGVLVALSVAAAAFAFMKPRLEADAAQKVAWDAFRDVADQLGFALEATPTGWPRLVGEVEGLAFEVDRDNFIGEELAGVLGLRCRLPHAIGAPNAALWIGEVPALRLQYGAPRPAGDSNGLFDVYTRLDPSASDWWQEPALHDALSALPGAGVLLHDGQLTVCFSQLEADTVRTALTVPHLVRRGVERVTLH